MHRPLIPVVLKIGKRQKNSISFWIAAQIHHGAKRMASHLGMTRMGTTITVEGIEGRGLGGVLAPLSIQIADEKVTIRCFRRQGRRPVLLSKADFSTNSTSCLTL